MQRSELLRRLSAKVCALLRQNRLVLITAESCTGGGIASAITDLSGSSAWFDRGFVTYSNLSKEELLDVPSDLILEKGAVSREVVLAMAAGALTHSRGDIAVACSGIAGPGGGTPEKPVGTVWMAWMERGAEGIARCERFEGDREAVREQAICAVFQGLIGCLESRCGELKRADPSGD